ncbi:2-oxoglutarate ferredoxin oxidoreductase subunit delta, partial [Dysosmobacter welbionis]
DCRHRRGRRPGCGGRVRHGDCHGRQRHGPGPQQEERPEGRQGCEDRHDRRRPGAGHLSDGGVRPPHPHGGG